MRKLIFVGLLLSFPILSAFGQCSGGSCPQPRPRSLPRSARTLPFDSQLFSQLQAARDLNEALEFIHVRSFEYAHLVSFIESLNAARIRRLPEHSAEALLRSLGLDSRGINAIYDYSPGLSHFSITPQGVSAAIMALITITVIGVPAWLVASMHPQSRWPILFATTLVLGFVTRPWYWFSNDYTSVFGSRDRRYRRLQNSVQEDITDLPRVEANQLIRLARACQSK